jgi:hypothetical protein
MCNFSQIYPMDRGTNYAVRDGNAMAKLILEMMSGSEAAVRKAQGPIAAAV